jgi:MFS family permease
MALPGWIRRLLWSSTITQGVIYILRPMITYRALELDASASVVGLIAALYALLPVLMALSFGRWAGTLGEGRFVIFGSAGLALSSAALLFSDSLALLAISAALSGTAHLACMVGGQTMVSLKSPRDKYDHYFGYYTFSASLGQLLGPLIAVLVAGSTGVIPQSIGSAFAVALAFSILSLVPVFTWRGEGPTVKGEISSGGALRSAGKLIRNPKIFAAIYTSLAISSVGDILIVFLPLFGTEKKFSSFSIGVIIAIRAGASMLSRLSLGALSNRFTTKQILVVSNSISVVTCFAMAFASNVFTLAILVLIAGFSLGVGQPLTMSLVTQATRPEERAIAVSARLTGNRFGQFVIPAGAGLVAASSGTSAVFIGLSILLATTFLTPQR